LTPAIGNVTFTLPTANIEQQSIHSDYEEKEKEKLKNDLQQLKSELQKSKETIARLQKSEEQMRER
jgi:phosphoenolpyruvate-protein kinase (PTS system EI component)